MKRLNRVGHLVTVGVFWGIIFGLTIDISKQEMGQPLIYKAEIAQAEEQPEVVLIEEKIDWTKERIRQEVDLKATEYNVPADAMWDTIMCESGASTTIQSYYVRKDGTREQSYGLAQIHLPDHPNVTYEQAIDPEFAIEFMAKNWHNVTWYCRDT